MTFIANGSPEEDDVITGCRPTKSSAVELLAVVDGMPPRDGGGVKCMTGNADDEEFGDEPEVNSGPNMEMVVVGGNDVGSAA